MGGEGPPGEGGAPLPFALSLSKGRPPPRSSFDCSALRMNGWEGRRRPPFALSLSKGRPAHPSTLLRMSGWEENGWEEKEAPPPVRPEPVEGPPGTLRRCSG